MLVSVDTSTLYPKGEVRVQWTILQNQQLKRSLATIVIVALP